MDDEEQIRYFTCPECRAGMMRRTYMAYFTWLSGELISVPDFPAWVCDMCGLREYDAHAVSWLNILLNPNTGRSPKSSRRRPKPPERPPTQPTSS